MPLSCSRGALVAQKAHGATRRQDIGKSVEEDFDPHFELERIINKFDHFPKERINKLKRMLPDSLIKELDSYRGTLFSAIEIQDLIDKHMPVGILAEATIKKIRSVCFIKYT